MKKCVAVVLMGAAMAARAEVTPQEMLDAVDKMTPQEAYDLALKLEAKTWDPIPEGFFSRIAARLDAAACWLDDVDLGGLNLSAGSLDVEEADGLDITVLWQLFRPDLRLGFRIGAFSVEDSDLDGGGYSRVTLDGAYGEFVANWACVRRPHWLVWGEAGIGGGGLDVESVDTPAGAATTLREFDGDFWLADLRAGVTWMFNDVLSLSLSGGYRFAGEADLDEGGHNTGLSADPSGPGVQLGLGINF
jgi:hypothetical protein